MHKKRSPEYTNKYTNFSSVGIIHWALRFPIFGLAVHWVFQGMMNMDHTERFFKIAFDIFITSMFVTITIHRLTFIPALLFSFFIAHSLNFLLNGQIWVVLKHYGYVHWTFEQFEKYRISLSERINKQKCILYAAIYGSIVRGQWKGTSDLDVRLVREKGFMNGIRASFFVLSERSKALFHGFPLDVYSLDNFSGLKKMREDEQPFIIKNIRGDQFCSTYDNRD